SPHRSGRPGLFFRSSVFAKPLSPNPHRDLPGGGNRPDLILGTDQDDLGVEWLCQGLRGNLGPDTTWVTESDGEAGHEGKIAEGQTGGKAEGMEIGTPKKRSSSRA